MTATDNLSPAQFPGNPDTSDSDRDKAAAYDAKDMDSDESFGFSEADAADYQYERYGKSKTDTRPKRQVF